MQSSNNDILDIEETNLTLHEKQPGTDFYVFVVYLSFVFLNPQNLVPGLKALRLALLISALALVLFIGNGRAVGALRFRQSKLLILLCGISFLATLMSIDFDISLAYWFYVVKALFMYFLFLFAMENQSKITTVFWIMLVLMFLDVAVSLVMQKLYMIGYRLKSFDDEGGANDYALMILSMMPFAIHFMEHAKTKKGRWFSGACLLGFSAGSHAHSLAHGICRFGSDHAAGDLGEKKEAGRGFRRARHGCFCPYEYPLPVF